MILQLMRIQGKNLRAKFASIVISTLITGLLVASPIPANAAACTPTSTTASNGDTILTFSTVGNCEWTVPAGVGTVQIVVVGGGGASGAGVSGQWWGAGGGGGQVTSQNISVTAGNTIAISVGAGGNMGDGAASTFGIVSASGGKAPTNTNRAGGDSGSNQTGGLTGLTGVASGGGGGADTAGSGMNAGVGITSSITDTAIEYGGGGTGYNGTSSGTQRVGAGRYNVAPTANRGGGASWMAAGRGVGGSGVVIVRYVPACSPTTTTTDSNYVLTFSDIGKCAWSTPAGVSSIDLLVVAGGGGGGDSDSLNYRTGGTGGAGGYFSSTNLNVSGVVDISVGNGGAGAISTTTQGSAGGDSAFGPLKVGGGGGGNSWNFAAGSAAGSGRGDNTYLIGGNGGGARSRQSLTAAQLGGTGGSHASSGITFLGSTITGSAGVQGNASNSVDAFTGGVGGSISQSSRTSAITGTSIVYAKSASFGPWAAGAQTYGSSGDTKYIGGTNDGSTTGSDGAQGVVIISYVRPNATITYLANGATVGIAPNSDVQNSSSDLFTLPSFTGTKNSMRFMSWNTAADGSGTYYAAGSTLRPIVNVTLYAQWMGAYCPENWTWTEPTCSKNYPGQQNFVIPWGFKSLDVVAIGGSGANGARGVGGVAGKIQASYSFAQGDVIRFFPGAAASGIVGGADTYPDTNYNGGNGLTNNGGSGGGGAGTVVTKNGVATSNVIVVAGGGGGGGANNGCYSQFNPITSTPGNPAPSSNGFTYGTNGASHGYNMFSGAGGGGVNGGKNGGATAAYTCSSGNDNGGLGLGGYRGGNTAVGASTVVSDGANSVNGVAGSVTLQLTRPVINYNLNGAAGTAPAKQVQSSEGEDLVVAAVGVARAGFTFGGWYPTTNATGTLYSPGDLYNTNAVLNLYAKWTSTITFSGNSSTGGTAPATITVLGTNATVLPANTGSLARTNFLFDGWNALSNGSGTHFPTGTSYTTTGDITLYARWNSTITYNGNGNTSGTAPLATIARGTAANTTLATAGTLSKTGATFSGWNTSQDGTGTNYTAGLTTYAANGSVILYAKWIVSTSAPTLATSSDLGTSNSDKITSDNTPDISVSGLVSGSSVEITATPASGSATTCTFIAQSTSGTCTFSTLADQTYTFTAKQTYNGGTSLTSSTLASVVIDSIRPTVSLSATVGAGTNVESGSNDLIALGAVIKTYTIKATFSEAVSGLLISEITKDAASTSWALGTTLSGSGASYTFTTTNSGALVNDPGKLMLRIAQGVATDTAGNTNSATSSDFILNSVARVDFWDCGPIGQYCTGGAGPSSLTQGSLGASFTLPGPNTLYRNGHSFAGWGETANASTILTGSYTPTTRIKLIPQWTPSVYVVTYNANGGNGAPATTSQNFTFGGTALVPSGRGTLTRTGYTFGGWSTTAVASGTIYSNPSDTITATTTKTYSPTASITLYAKWDPGTFAVTFDANGGTGTQIANMSITAGTAKSLTANSYTRAGFTFGGWNTLANGNGTAYANAASVTLFGNTTIYAQWIIVKPGAPSVSVATAGNTTATVTVTGGTVSGTTTGPATSYSIQTYASDGTTIVAGKSCTLLATASPLSCQITGLTNGTTYKFLPTAINTTGSTTGSISTVTATPAPFVVTYSLNGGTLSPATANFNLGSPLTLELPTRNGYTFGGWFAESGLSTLVGINGGSYSPGATTTLYAKWTGNVYSITYNGNGSDGGLVPSAANFTFGNSYTIAAKGTMTKSGYTFSGWTIVANSSNTPYANASDSIPNSIATYSTAANLVLYAKWTPQVYTITYDKNGSGGAPSKTVESFTFGSTPLTLPTVTGMTYANYTFGGWSESPTGTAVISPYSPTQTRTLYAIWTGIQYSITYNSNGGTGSVPDAVYTTGSTGLTLSDGSTLSRAGYNFGGWKNLAGQVVSGSAYTATENVTLYAIWTPKIVVVTYDKGIATGTLTTFPTTPDNATFGTNFTLGVSDTSTATAGGNYAFAGWKIGNIIYKPGDSYRISAEEPVSIVAQWIQLFEVTYNTNGGTFAAGDGVNDQDCGPSKLCADNSQIVLNATPLRTGFTFAGWVSQTGSNFAAQAQTNVTATNYIFYATWTPNSYRITYSAGTGTTASAAPVQTGNFGEVITLASGSSYILSGSVFSGWLITSTLNAGALYTFGTDAGTLDNATNTFELTATAQFVNNTFKFFYNTNGATSGATPSATAGQAGSQVTLNNAAGFARDGYTFDGWSDGATTIAAPFIAIMGSTNNTLVAQWKIALPATPTISSISGSDGGATITVAAGIGGGTASSYTVTSSPSGGSCTIITPALSCFVTPLTNGTPYTLSVTANNSTGSSSAALSTSITPAGKPDAPSNVSASIGNGSATVSFTAPTVTGGPAIASYTVTAYPGGATCTVNSPATSCVVPGLTNGTEYTFTVTASNGINTSDASTSSFAVTPATVPNAPTSISATSTASGTATVTFTAPSNTGGSSITGYVVSSSPVGATCVVGANATTYTCTGLTDGTSYTFSVKATNAIGDSSDALSGSVTPQGAASEVTTISATTGDSSSLVTLSGAVTNGSTITGYTVQAYDSTGTAVTGATCTVTSSATSGSCTVTGLTNGSEYTFKAITNSSANSTSVTSVESIATIAVIPAKAPDAPTSLTTTSGTGKISVSWTVPADNGASITSYTVKAYDNAGNEVSGATCVATAPATTCDVSTNLVAGTAYTFKVTATSLAGTSSASTASGSASVNAAPSVPRNVTAQKGNTIATVSWDAPLDIRGSDITGYTVTAYSSNNVASGICTTVAPTQSCEITGLTNGSPYTFKVTATNGIGTSGESIASSAATPSTVPNTPTGITVAAGDAQVTVSFTAPANDGGSAVTGYTIFASDGSTISGSTSPLIFTGLTNGSAYTFTVKATNINGDSIASSTSLTATPVERKAPELVTPGQPTGQPYVGSTLTSNVSFSGSPTPTITYQWKVCDDAADLGSCTIISGATSATYSPVASEAGKFIVVVATADNGVGSPLAETSNPTAIIKPEVVISGPTPVPGANAGTAYSLNLSATGGATAIGFTVSNGTLPAGLTLDSATGQLSGTPTTAGTYTFTVRATDSNGMYKDLVVTVVVGAVIETCDSSCRAAAAAAQAAAEAAAQAALAEAARQAELARQQEAARQAALVAEAARIAAEAKALADKKAAEEAARIAAEKAAAEAKALADKKAAEEAARLAAEAKALADKKAAEEAARIAAEKAAAEAKALADKKAAEEAARLAELARLAAEKAAAEKLKSDELAKAASIKAKAEAEAAIVAAKAAVEKAAAAEAAKVAAEAAALAAATQAKAASDAQAAAVKAATAAATELKNASATAETKATATKSAQKAVADAEALVRAAAKAAQVAATAQNAAANANKQVDITINSLNSKTAASQTLAQANAIAAAAKAAANEAAALAATKAVEAKTAATAAQKAASETAARIATEQKEAAASAALAKNAADELTKVTVEKISTTSAAKIAFETLLKVLEEKANLADQAVKATDLSIRSEIEKKIEELTVRITQAQKISQEANTKAENAAAIQEVAAKKAESTKAEAVVQAAEAVAVKSESVAKTVAATKAAAAAVVAAKVATAAKEAAAKVPSRAVISTKPSTSSKKNSATATVTGLKPGQKVKVTVNVRPKP